MRTYVRLTYPAYIREKARQLRTERRMSLNEIAECLAIPKTTVWYWIEDLPDPEIRYRDSDGRQRGRLLGAAVTRARAKARRDRAYRQGWDEFALLDAEPGFRDFVCLYIGEGYKRSRNQVALGNSDPRVVRLANLWICRFTTNRVAYGLQYHADQDPEYLVRFWSACLDADPARFRLQRKSNSGQLSGRKWRSRWGVLTVGVGDTYLRSRLQGWIDRVQDSWLDSIHPNLGV
jgi:hypothetical protein